VGPDGIFWDLDHHAVQHGIYQQFLQSLAEDGILLAVASKNDSQRVEQAFRRADLLLKPESLFPVEVHWSPKPESAARILQAWNIGEDSVVFLDDSPMEVAAMRMAFPKMDCREFPVGDPAAFAALLANLTSCFGQAQRSEEDALRLASLRTASLRSTSSNGYSPEDLLKSCNGVLTVTRLSVPPDPRALELLNKTNQFNLNGERQTEADWLAYLRVEGAAAWIASYGDKFGPLGKIAVLAGRHAGNRLEVDWWVMSCRAFSRRIEYALLDYLFSREPIEEITLNFRATERNGPLREFLQCLAGEPVQGGVHLTPDTFAVRKPALYMSVTGGL
jgi:FkbH-like protein